MKRWNKVPERGAGKNIVVCIDGTGNGPRGAEATNVWRLFEALAEIPGQQCKCYLPEVGAQRGAPIYTPGKNWTLRVRRLLTNPRFFRGFVFLKPSQTTRNAR